MSNSDVRSGNASRWFRALTRLFPQGDRDGRVAEMLDALALNANTSTRRETLSFIWAACVAWRRYSFSRDGVQQAAFAGALIWFGLLVSLGPIVRLKRQGDSLGPPGYPTSVALHVAAASCLIAAIVLLASHRRSISRFGAWVVFPVALVAAAATNRVGEFQLFRSLAYEARWLGLAFGLATLLRPRLSWRWPVVAALGPATLLMLIPPVHGYQFSLGHNYGRALQVAWFDGSLGNNNLIDLIAVLALFVVLVAPFFCPAVAAFFTVPIFGVLVAPTARVAPAAMIATMLTLALYLSLVALWSYRRPKLNISIDRHESRGKRIELSCTFIKDKNRW